MPPMADEHTFNAKVLTPEGEVFDGDVVQLSTRTAVGEIGILANHVPMMARLRPTELRLHISDGEVRRWAQAEGWLEVFANHALVLVGEAIAPDELDTAQLKERISAAEQRTLRDRGGDRRPRRGGAGEGARRDVPVGHQRHLTREERELTERLIAYDTSGSEGLRDAVGFVRGWLSSRGISTRQDVARAAGDDGRGRPGATRRRWSCTATSTSSPAATSSSSPGSTATG